MNFQEFISNEKTLLIAPAGYGKTYTLAKCLKYTPANKKQLILTHTHAGIASIKEKIKKFNILHYKYHIETIMGFAQKYVLAYYSKNDIPAQEDSDYYNFIIKKAKKLFQLTSVKRTIKYSYDGLFVDEYQDCTTLQHKMLIVLSEVLGMHILGDSMQGIFGFKERLVDFENDLIDFVKVDELDKPWRWYKNGNNRCLGDSLKEIRSTLLSQQKTVDLSSYGSAIDYIKINEGDIYVANSKYRTKLNDLIINLNHDLYLNSFLLIVPEPHEKGSFKGSINSRAELKTLIDYSHRLILLEAIDNKDFYSISKNIDELVEYIDDKEKKIEALTEDVFIKLFNKTDVHKWIKDDKLINKRGINADIKNDLENKINSFFRKPSASNFSHIIFFMKSNMKFKTKRRGLLNGIIEAMKIAISENKTVYESMVCHKNIIRRVGKPVYGKCMGTTLLTKGLEFDTVVILDAHKFYDYKHFYVAITRACKKLIIFSEKEILNFNKV